MVTRGRYYTYLMAVHHCIIRHSGQEEHVVFICDVNYRQSVFIKGEADLLKKFHLMRIKYTEQQQNQVAISPTDAPIVDPVQQR